ncbi:MAG: O-methyltransferase [Muribaculaceae bacterium]|nr:O-methyltransferase [Muribaculaceae bacterium]
MDPLLEAYIEAHISAAPENLSRLERATNLQRVNGRMCSGLVQGRILKMLTRMVNPRRALELGTFTGYSALCIAEGLAPEASLVTIELEEELELPIRQAFDESPHGEKIDLIIGDALDVCAGLPDEEFDLIFIDADKRQYPAYYREAKRLLSPGGFIIADNTLWDSHIIEPGRHDRQTEGIREFNSIVAQDPEMEVAVIPVRDGLTLIYKPKIQAPAPDSET